MTDPELRLVSLRPELAAFPLPTVSVDVLDILAQSLGMSVVDLSIKLETHLVRGVE